jgi:hypothetical protein
MGTPNLEGKSNIDVLAGGVFGSAVQSFATVNAPVVTVAGVLYYDTTVGNLMISDASGVYHKITNA